MSRRQALEERVAILEERLKAFEPPPEHKLALADCRAEARCARERAKRWQRGGLIFAASTAGFWILLDAFLVLRWWLSGP